MKFNELKKIALNKTQMRAIKGGGNCGAVSGSGSVICNVTKEQAQFWVTEPIGVVTVAVAVVIANGS